MSDSELDSKPDIINPGAGPLLPGTQATKEELFVVPEEFLLHNQALVKEVRGLKLDDKLCKTDT
ncbi:hypothetical protein SERLA73DRAFT_68235 [Serpula lacrymans var. lacrymans S7.3]|uniref:Uncharacterized protein n=2 Tax=Serpula lacrymans var. lacrymans TaxID=341189 RepID=F8PHR6_SERL3|nr:uncharacterized protein SERLADRAFT_431973 [Serpula lacrymans var. lacrymans S7.9]EGO04545.1 hypothetical protein SERLA73DRAFT_68235 [Serpula lacrymans var. lacrymans S7.3]EGO30426.1 hypothetical protein SERLADRAFT_431973 [Serpula lacrymans var. lacrymans S7.9]